MDIVALLPFIVLIGAMFLMTRSAKNKQRAAANMRDQMQPGTGVRTIGGLYATVKEVNPDTVVVEIAPGVHATFAKNAIGAVLEDEEYDRIVNGVTDDSPLPGGTPVVPDSPAGLAPADPVDLGKSKDAEGDALRDSQAGRDEGGEDTAAGDSGAQDGKGAKAADDDAAPPEDGNDGDEGPAAR